MKSVNNLILGWLFILTAVNAFLFLKVNQLSDELLKVTADLKAEMAQSENSPGVISQPQSPFDLPNNDPTKSAAVPPRKTTSIRFEKMSHDFGRIKDGQKAQTKFRFTNTGSEPLTIISAAGSCGCTVPSFPKEPLPPGKSADIDVVFDSSGKTGEQTKTVTVRANTLPAMTELTIKATVLPKD